MHVLIAEDDRVTGEILARTLQRWNYSTTVVSEIAACTIIINFAQRDSTGTSVGEKAVLVLNARNR